MDPNVKAWMSGSPISVDPDAAVLDAHDRMVESGIRHLPVVDAQRRVIGVLSLDDLRAALPMTLSARAQLSVEDRELAREWTVGEVMTHAPETALEGSTLGEAADRMADRRIGCLPVVDDAGQLVGMFTETDALRALATAMWCEQLAEERVSAGEHEILIEQLRAERTRLAERDASPAVAPAAERRVAAIESALDRAEQGRLGVCERCGGEIPVPRLRAMPGTTLCVACAVADSTGEFG